jgi:hypothetical protein
MLPCESPPEHELFTDVLDVHRSPRGPSAGAASESLRRHPRSHISKTRSARREGTLRHLPLPLKARLAVPDYTNLGECTGPTSLLCTASLEPLPERNTRSSSSGDIMNGPQTAWIEVFVIAGQIVAQVQLTAYPASLR